jgi:uncharacterized protein (TIGR00266 family)
MNYSISNAPIFTTLTVQLRQGESFRAESGAMIAMSPTIAIKASGSGKGLFGSIKAAIGGESLFASIYTAENGSGEIVLAPSAPGDILKFELKNQTILAQGGAYLAGEVGLDVSTQGSLKAWIGGEGLFLSKISGTGLLFLNSYGAIIEKTIVSGEEYIIDSGHIVAFESSLNYDVQMASRGVFSSIATGEGLVCRFRGEGTLWYQTRNVSALASLIKGFIGDK